VTLSQSRPRSDQPIAQLRLLRPTDVAFSARSVRPLTTLDNFSLNSSHCYSNKWFDSHGRRSRVGGRGTTVPPPEFSAGGLSPRFCHVAKF